MAAYEDLDASLEQVMELEPFLHELLGQLPDEGLEDGDDLLEHAKKLGVRIPQALEGSDLAWDAGGAHAGHAGADALVLVRPGHPDAVGLVIKCVRWGRWKACLECGWIWCRIVITRRF